MPRGETLTVGETWDLARAWYHDRLDPGFRGRSVAEAEAIFQGQGLTSTFWRSAHGEE